MNPWPSPGIHESVPFSIYRSDDITQADDAATVRGKAVSKSLITDFIPDPSAWKSSPPKRVTAAMRGGSLFDTLLTEPLKLESRFVVSEHDDFRSNESKAWKAEMEAAGMTVIKQAEMDAARAQFAAVTSKPEAMALIKGARMQVAFRHPTKYGFDSKGLIDLVPMNDDMLVDIKTCESGALESKRALQRHIFEWGYHIQAGAYCDGWAMAGGNERIRFKFIFVTSKPPFRVAVIELPLAAILLGADQYRAGCAKLAECIETDRWPSIWDGEVALDLPEYAYTESEL